jgi:NADH-ubiquinone oxidoreductase chain 1
MTGLKDINIELRNAGLLVIVPALLSVAFVTIAERKTMASMQRRLGPNVVFFYI